MSREERAAAWRSQMSLFGSAGGCGSSPGVGYPGTALRRVYDEIERAGLDGATCDEVENALLMAHQTASPRILELRQTGDVVDSGRERRRTKHGEWATVWVALASIRQGR